MKQYLIIAFVFLLFALLLFTAGCQKQDQLVGDDRDEHSCIPSAGYQWCEITQKCQRFWEEPCEQVEVTNFEECAAAGNPVMESYPRQCRHGDQTFVEEIEVEEPEETCVDQCGDGVCAEFVCMAIGCPCAETPESCPEDCKEKIQEK